jgi:hypothetical protein
MLYLMVMPMPSLRRLTLADTTDETVRRLIDHGEDLFVERKQELPSGSGFGATVASFANTLGGWILLGVADDQSLVGYPNGAVLDLQSHIGHILVASRHAQGCSSRPGPREERLAAFLPRNS